MIDWTKWTREPDGNTEEYPTIVDIVNDIIQKEEQHLFCKYPLNHYHFGRELECPGRFVMISRTGDNEHLELLPTSKSKLTYYRGQNDYYKQCLPSLYRKTEDKEEKKVLRSRLQISELKLCLLSHPVIWDLVINRFSYENKIMNIQLPIHFDGLAQHYGIETTLLDLTADKWVAAFFASTICKDDEYYPVDPSIENHPKIGVFYRYSWLLSTGELRPNGVHGIGLQYFNRPGKQSAVAMDLKDKRDFHSIPGVEKIFFRHDKVASELIYDMCQQKRRLFPEDSLADMMKPFLKANVFSLNAVNRCREYYYPEKSMGAFSENVIRHGFQIAGEPQLFFDQDKAQREFEEWNQEGRKRYLEKLVVLPMMKIPIT